MRFYSYVVARDYGFAPNPFSGYCTLATCKQQIRKNAITGDWIIGSGSATRKMSNHIVFAMEINEILSFDNYWADIRFETKKANMDGSLKKMYGDNIYHRHNDDWIQEDSHHSYENGETNHHNLNRDTSADAVLVSENFYYFGKSAIELATSLASRIIKKGPGYRCPEYDDGIELIEFLSDNHGTGYQDDPILMTQFQRYNGIS